MLGKQLSNRFDLADNGVIHEDVGEVHANCFALVLHLDWSLGNRGQSKLRQLFQKRADVDLLEEAVAQISVDLVGRTDDLSGEVGLRIPARRFFDDLNL